MSPAAKTSGKTAHTAVRVDGDEPLDRLRQAVDPRPAQAWQRDDAVGRDPSLGDEAQLTVHHTRPRRSRS